MTGPMQVRRISDAEHVAYVAGRPSVSFLQTPAWGRVKREWRSESLGWVDRSGEVRGAGLVLYRQVPRLRRFLAYLPEGPDLPWGEVVEPGRLQDWLGPLRSYLAEQKSFAIRLGPPVVTRTWDARTVKDALAAPTTSRLVDLPPTRTDAVGQALAAQLREAGWQPPAQATGFATGQPQYVFWLPLDGRSSDDVFAGFNQLWRRNVRRAEKSGVEVSLGGRADLAEFHDLYLQTAARDHFTPRPLEYFQGMWDAMTSEQADRLRLYLARHAGDLVASTTMVQVGRHAWYSYGASSTEKRDVRGSNAIQWRMISDALAGGAAVYDLRGITDTLDPQDPHVGLIQFKLGTGGEAVEYVGEWTLPINALLHHAFEAYLRRRSR